MRIAGISLLLFCALARAQNPPKADASIEGTLTDAATSLPIPDIEVRANGPGNPSSAKSDSKGGYIIHGLPGSYQLFIAPRADYAYKARRVRLLPGQEL